VKTSVAGTVDKVVYRGENGFAVARVATGAGAPITAAGRLDDVVEGETVKLEGEWVQDPRFGRQLKVVSCTKSIPTGAEAAERFLASGLVKGVRARTAKKIVDALGAETLQVILETPAKLDSVKGLGKKKKKEIVEGVKKALATRAQESFLRGLGLGPGVTARIVSRYGEESRSVVEKEPYRLARELEGVGFLTADRIARARGVPRDDPGRLVAGLAHALSEASESRGDSCLPRDELLARAAKLLGLEGAAAGQALGNALEAARGEGIVALDAIDQGEHAYLPALLNAERGAARGLAAVSGARKGARLAQGVSSGPVALTPEQRGAVEATLGSGLSVITGGPGVGKTTVTKALVLALEARGEKVLLAAPTGRAAKRLEEASGREARTLHRMLEWNPREATFVRDAKNPLEKATVIVDEASMLDVRLAHALARALAPGSALVLVGDQDQLPSVGAGNVLADVIASGVAVVSRLAHVFRQARASRIVANAHEVRAGRLPDLEPPAPGELEDYFFIEKDDAEGAREAILKVVAERIPRKFGLDARRDVQVLAPMRKGACGAEGLNAALRARLNPAAREGQPLAVGDKVMQIKNDYDRDVFNGDVGEVVAQDERGEVRVRFEGRDVSYDRGAANALVLAYCVTVHKSQGGEFPAVVVPVLLEHWVLLARNLLYTAMTRGRKLVVLVGQRKALERAVANVEGGETRRSHLASRLHEAAKSRTSL
jgi:exodeoxyribonuclease V alpha subunit